MKKMMTLAMTLMILITALLFTGCGEEKPVVNLNAYIRVTEEGFDGMGRLYVEIDIDSIISDNEKYLSSKHHLRQYPFVSSKGAVWRLFEDEGAFTLVYDDSENLQNGQKVKFSWEKNPSAIQDLKKILKVDFKCKDLTYTVQNLKPTTQVDLAETLEVEFRGLNQEGYIYRAASSFPVNGDNSNTLYANWDREQKLSNGDTVCLEFDFDQEYYARYYGIEFVNTQQQITVSGLDYPGHHKAQWVVDNLTQESIDNATSVCLARMKKENRSTQDVQFVGAEYIYGEEDGKLALYFHVTDGIVPQGWYTYLVYKSDLIIKETEDGIQTLTGSGKVLDTYESAYLYERRSSWIKEPVECTFTHEETKYTGHLDLAACCRAMMENVIRDDYASKELEQTVQSDSLKAQLG